MSLSPRVRALITSEDGIKYHAILQVLSVATAKGYNSAEVARIRQLADAQWGIAHAGILSSTDIGALVKNF